ncbi:MAG: histidinol-phosphate transaminase [Coriobacteriales bacterium]|jgi:histidinol-phosphate aminotransferase|nr:histidinol-phosphate transaminase [Coriobacteriales bacterium]
MDWEQFFKKTLEVVQPYQPGLREEQVRVVAQTSDIYKLSSNESPLPPFPAALAAMHGCLESLNEYSDGSVHALTERLSQKYRLPAGQIMVGNGTNELLSLIAESCLGPCDEIVYGWPSFVVYRMSAQIAGATYREVPLTPDGAYDLEGILAAVTPQTKIVYVCSPNNPSGGVVTGAEFDAFIRKVPGHVLTVIDNAYVEFVDGEDTFDALAYFDGVRPYVVLRTFSKAYALAGLRIGYGFAPCALVDVIDKLREPFNVNTVAQVAALACVDDDAELARRRALNTAGRERLYGCFDRLGLRYFRSAGNFVWVFVPNAAAAFDQLLRRGIIVRPFPGANGLRVGVGDEEGVSAVIREFEELFA